MDLHSKKILFIGIGFYDYERLITQKLEESGAVVSYFSSVSNIKPINLLFRLGLIKLAMLFKNRRRKKLIKASAENVDIIFTIKGQELSLSNFKELKKRNPNAQWVLYLWDSLVRHDNQDLLFEYFDTIYSFDRQDCQNNNRLKFRPLFYRDNNKKDQPRIYDLSFIGWAHSDRIKIIRLLKTQLQEFQCNFFIKLYFGPFDYLVQKYVYKAIGKNDADLVIIKPIPYNVFSDILSSSKVVLDISHPKQSGLTMRTIETLAAGCKLLTTNNDIVNYSQIDQQNIYIIDRNDPIIPQSFFDDIKNHLPEQQTLSNYFYIDNFLEEILAQYSVS